MFLNVRSTLKVKESVVSIIYYLYIINVYVNNRFQKIFDTFSLFSNERLAKD